ncbi:MAG TPA: glycosyltransferase family 39 protein, partial [bacterium]|nr:glycosyltransferase family 39 protein [bacterium]
MSLLASREITDPRSNLRKRPAVFLTVLILSLFALTIRLWKIHYGLPYFDYSDELRYAFISINMGGGDLNPHFFLHPSLFFYLWFAGDVFYVLIQIVKGTFHSARDAWGFYLSHPTAFHLIGRGVSALMGTLTVPLTYLLGREVLNKRIGLLASFFVTFSFLHIQLSQMAYLDTTLTFFMTLAFLFAFCAAKTGKLRYFILCGLAGGLSLSSKYNGFPSFLLGPLACVYYAWDRKKSIWEELVSRKFFLFCFFFLFGFTAGTPFWILDFPKFKTDFLWTWGHYKTTGKGQFGYEGNGNWLYYLKGPLTYGYGLPLVIFGILGMIGLLRKPKDKEAFLAVFPALYFFIAGFSKIHAPRYMVPLTPFLCLAAATLMEWILNRLDLKKKKKGNWLLAFAGALIILPSMANTVRMAYLRTQPETRFMAYEWVQQNLPKGSEILYSDYGLCRYCTRDYKARHIDPTIFDTRIENVSSLKTLEEYK